MVLHQASSSTLTNPPGVDALHTCCFYILCEKKKKARPFGELLLFFFLQTVQLATLASQVRSQHAQQRMLALRHFKALCGFGVVLGGLSFILAVIAIATDPWFVSFNSLDYVEEGGDEMEEEEQGNDTTTSSITTSVLVSPNTTIGFNMTRKTLSGLWRVCYKDTGVDFVSGKPHSSFISSCCLVQVYSTAVLTSPYYTSYMDRVFLICL